MELWGDFVWDQPAEEDGVVCCSMYV